MRKNSFLEPLLFHFRQEEKTGQIREDQGRGNSGRTGSKASCEKSQDTVFFNGFFHSFPQHMAETDQGNRSSGTCKIHQRLVDTNGTLYGTAAHQKYHHAARHQLCFVQKDLDQGADETTEPECVEIIHTYTSICSMTTPWAIPGILSPSLKLTLERRAPVGTKRIRFHSPDTTFGRI